MNRINHSSRFFSQFAKLPFDHKWKDVLTIINGKAYGEDYKDAGTYPICGSGGIMGYGEKKMCHHDTIILGRKGNIDKPIYMTEDYWIVDTAFCLSADTELIHPVYLYYWCKQFDFQKLNKQAVLPSLTRSDLEQIDIQVPNMAEQLAFVEVVQQADKSKFNGFKSRFFEQFQGKGYQSQKLNSFAQVVTGSTPSRSVSDYWLNGTHPWVSAQDMGDKFVDATAELVSDSGMATCKLIPAGSLLYVCRGSIGVMSINRIDCATNQSICSAICDVSICKTEYLYYWLLYHEDEINSLGEGTSFKSLSQKTFASLEIQIPPIEEQLRFIEITRQADKSKYLN